MNPELVVEVSGVEPLAAGPLAPILWVRDLEGRVEFVDARGAAAIGRSADELHGRSWLELLHPDDVDVARHRLVVGRRDQHPYETQLRLRVGAEYHWMNEHGSPVFDSEGSLSRWAGTLTDVEVDRQWHELRQRQQSEATHTRALLDTLQDGAPIGILFVDREFRYLRVNDKIAALHGTTDVDAHIGHTVAEVVPELWRQLEPHYRSVLATGVAVTNIELTGPTAEDPGHPHSWLESIFPVRVDGEIVGLGVALIDITERKRVENALASLTETAVDAIAAAAEARDPYTAGHQRRVAELSVAIAKEMGIPPGEIEGVRFAAKIHDIGKLRTPSEILNKTGELSRTEMSLLREHAQAGYDIVQGIDFPWPVADMILQHHERLDGSGYPNHLVGEQILLGARIIAVADIVDAMSSHRPYRPSRGVTAALRHIEHERGARLDVDVVDVCIRLFRDRQFTFALGHQRANGRDLRP
jgi:PAS domain S-box-containing protein/putative nucleotidyltransferase with HDIG domain